MIHNTPSAPFAEAILALARSPEGVTAKNTTGAKPAYFYKLAIAGRLFTTKQPLGAEPKRYFDSQERADAFYAGWAPSKKTHPKRSAAAQAAAFPVDFINKKPQAGGPARLAGEPVITADTKFTIAPPPPAVLYRSNTFTS